MNSDIKPMLSAHDLIEKLKKEKGIKFELVTEIEAEEYLSNVNNYLRTASYRKNFPKYTKGVNEGKYIDLDFALLMDLSSIDFHLREIILKICIDIEHDLKIGLLKSVGKTNLDGYDLVDEFLDADPTVLKGIANKRTSAYTADLIDKYFTFQTNADGKREVIDYDCPIWVLLEVISFGEFIRLYEYYYSKYEEPPVTVKLLNSVKSLRNACAHNNCLIYNLHPGNSKAPSIICREVSKIGNISRDSRIKKLSSRFILEYISALFVYKKVCSKKAQISRICELKKLYEQRMLRNKGYYLGNDLLISSYNFTYQIIKAWNPSD